MDFLNEDSNVLVFSLLVEVFIASVSLKPCVLVLDGIEELIGIYGISGQKVTALKNYTSFMKKSPRFLYLICFYCVVFLGISIILLLCVLLDRYLPGIYSFVSESKVCGIPRHPERDYSSSLVGQRTKRC